MTIESILGQVKKDKERHNTCTVTLITKVVQPDHVTDTVTLSAEQASMN